MGTALVQTERATSQARATAFWASVAFGTTLSLLVIALAGPVGRLLDDPRIGTMVAVGGLTFAICSVGSSSQAIFMREMRFRSIELRYWFALVLASALAVTAATLGAGAWALVAQQVALQFVFAWALWWRAGWRPTLRFSTTIFRGLVSFALRIAGGRWARLLELLVLTVLVGKLVGIAALGAWTFAMATVILPLTVIVIPIAEVLFSAFSRLQDDRGRIAALWLESIRFLAAVILPLLVGLAVVAPDLVPLVFGAHWEVSVPVVQILSAYVIIRGLQSWSSIVLDAIGRPQVTLWTQCAALFLTPVGVVIGSQWGIEAVAVGFVLSQLIAVEIPVLIIALRELSISLTTLVARLLGVAAATLVMATACLSARLALSSLEVGMAGRALVTIVVGLVAYTAAICYLAPDVRDKVIELARRLVAKLSGLRARPRALQR